MTYEDLTKQKEMKVNELMIGDWVYAIDENGDKHIGRVNNLEYDYVNKRGSFCVDFFGTGFEPEFPDVLFNVQPIPLTPEILEKNFREYLPGINLMYQLKGPYFAMNEKGNQWVFGLVKEDVEKSCRYPLVKITYVHELQHALRLCGIEKSIEL